MNDLGSSYTEGSPACSVIESQFPGTHLSLLPEGWNQPYKWLRPPGLLPSAPLSG